RHTLAGHGFGTTAVAWCPGDVSLLASAGQDRKARLWDSTTGQERAALDGGAAWVEHLAWSPDGALLASAAGKKLRLGDRAGQLVRALPDQPSPIADLQWRPGDNALTSACYGAVVVWETEKGEPRKTFEWKGSVLKLAWAPDGKYLATGNQ